MVKKVVFRFFLSLISLFLALFLSDYLAGQYVLPRIAQTAAKDWRNESTDFTKGGCFQLSNTLGFEPVWGKCGSVNLPLYTKKFETSVLGADSNEPYKILLLGDSNTNRGNVDAKIESALNNNSNINGRSVKVFKVGVESYNTSQEIELLKTRLIDLHPNLIILQYTPNDFEFTPAVLKIKNQIVYLTSKDEAEMEKYPRLFELSNLYKLFELKKMILNDNTEKDTPEIWDREKVRMYESLSQLKTLTDNNKVLTVVVMYPFFRDIQLENLSDTFKQDLNQLGIEYIDMYPITLTEGGPQTFAEVSDNGTVDVLHPNRKFDDLVSKALVDYISSKNLIKI